MNQIFEKITNHVFFHQKIIELTSKMVESAQLKKMEHVFFLSDQRDRLAQIILTYYQEIETNIKELKPEAISKENIDDLKEWYKKIEINNQKLLDLDDQLITLLENEKDQVSGEISQIFKNKESVKGYNLSTVKR